MTIEPTQAPFLAAVLTAAIVLPAAAEAPTQTGAPNEAAGHLTNAFLPGFPEELDGMARSSIQSRPQEGRIMATYGTAEGDRNVQVLLYPLDERGIEGNVERAQSYLAGGEIPVTRESMASPDGTAMECMTSRAGELGYNFCVAEIHGRALNVQIGDVVSSEMEKLPQDVVERAHRLAGEIVDAVAGAQAD